MVPQLLRVLAPLLAILIVRTDRRLIRAVEGTRREQPVLLPPLNRLARWRLQRLLSVGAIGEASESRFFLEPDGWQRYRARRRKRMAIVLVGLLLVVLALWAASPD